MVDLEKYALSQHEMIALIAAAEQMSKTHKCNDSKCRVVELCTSATEKLRNVLALSLTAGALADVVNLMNADTEGSA